MDQKIVEEAKFLTNAYISMLDKNILPKWFPKEPGRYLEYAKIAIHARNLIMNLYVPAEDERMVGRHLGFCIHWFQSGMPVFKISDALAAAFILTDFDDITFKEINFPFHSFYIDITGVSPIRLEGVEIKQIGIMAGKEIPNKPLLRTRSQLESASTADRFVVSAVKADRTKTINASYPYNANSRVDSIEHTFSYDDKDKVDDEANKSLMTAIIKIAVGISNLLKNDHEEFSRTLDEARKRRPGGVKRLSGERTYTEIVVGKEIKIKDPLDLISIATKVSKGELPADGSNTWTLNKQILVRGYVRTVRYGTRNSLRKSVTVQPYMRGPDYAVRVERKFTIED